MRTTRSKIAAIAVIATLAAGAATAEETVEGVKVHGHWTIEVRDEHGTVVEHREFENALQTLGSEMLTKLFARQETFGDWEIRTTSAAGLEVCEEPAGMATTLCYIPEPTSPKTQNNAFKNLTLAVAPAFPWKLTFSGNFVAQRTGEVSGVALAQFACSSATAPDDCPGNPAIVDVAVVTNTNLAVSVAVTAGQQVLVTVELSFS